MILGTDNKRTSRRKTRNKLITLYITVSFVCFFFLLNEYYTSDYITDYLFSEHRLETNEITYSNDEIIELGLTPQEPVLIRELKTGKVKKIHGRFLHITDIHPDRIYEEGSSIENLCHPSEKSDNLIEGNNNEYKDKDIAPRFGQAMSGCDSSVDLMDYTLKWINETLRDKIDFVIWTGDNIRHDNDRQNPRTESQIFEMNEIVSGKFRDLFINRDSDDPRDFDVEVVPSLGNNDVFPHNMFSLGPTLQTREFFKIWSPFVPQEQQRFFNRGVTYLKEVIPGKLAVISINTLYLYKANPLVDNCNSRKEPGYQLLLWLGFTLEELRQRNMKVWLSGHVPPILKNFDESCYNKFTLWTHEYRDIIIGGVYGHMNMDHFIPVDGNKARDAIERKQTQSEPDEIQHAISVYEHAEAAGEAHLMGAKPVNKVTYMENVKAEYYRTVERELDPNNINQEALTEGDMAAEGKKKKRRGGKKKKGGKKKGKPTKEEIYEKYSIINVAGSVIPTFNPSFRIWEYNITGIESDELQLQEYKPWDQFFQELEIKIDSALEDDLPIHELDATLSRNKKTDKTIAPVKPDEYPLGPAYTSQLFSPIKFVEYFADLKQIDKDYLKNLKSGKNRDEAANEAFKYNIEYTSHDAPYSTDTLLVKDYINLAAKLCENNKKWEEFLSTAFISSGYKDEDEDD